MPIPLRADFDAPRLRAIARGTKDAAQTRRLLALAAVYGGARRTEAAAIGGVTLQIVRDWVIKFNAHGPDGLIARKAPGQPPKLNEAHRAALRAAIESGPTAAIDGVVRWRLVDLCQWIWEEFRVGIAKQTLSGNCVPWATASCPPDRVIMPKPTAPSRILKKLPRGCGPARA
jgi:transposase